MNAQGTAKVTTKIVDPEIPRAGDRREVQVAVGVLIRPGQQFLMTSRPEGKAYAGYWEFPGGKFEPNESLEQALRRELIEELGIVVGTVWPWREEVVDYPHALVRLHFCRVFDWQGALQMRESQSHVWASLPATIEPVLPGSWPVLEWLKASPELLAHPTAD